MTPPDEAQRDIVLQWFAKAEKDFDLALHLVSEGCSYREAALNPTGWSTVIQAIFPI